MCAPRVYSFFFFFNDTATTEIYTLSLHDALPIYLTSEGKKGEAAWGTRGRWCNLRSEEHTSELQSQSNLVCRLLLEKKKYKVATSQLSYYFDRCATLAIVDIDSFYAHASLRYLAL